MAVLQFVVYDILGEASLLIGLMAMVGLLIQRKPAEKVIAGTIKTIVGFLIFGIGSSAAQGALNGFQSLFVTAFGLEGVTPISEAITAQAQTLFPMVIALIMVGGFVCNLVIAKLTKFKYIFLTGGHSLFLSALLAILLKALGLSDVAAILIGSVIHGFAAALYPEYRGQGFGTAFLNRLAAIAVERGCGRLEWWCLDWNKPSIDFYLGMGARPMSDWTVYRIDGERLEAMAADARR